MIYSQVTRLNLRVGVLQLSHGQPDATSPRAADCWHFIPNCLSTNEVDRVKWYQHLKQNLQCVIQLLKSYDTLTNCPSSSVPDKVGSHVTVEKHATDSSLGYVLYTKKNITFNTGTSIFAEHPLAFVTEKDIAKFLSIFQPHALITLSQIADVTTRETVASFLLPGHCFALLAAFPLLSVSNQQQILSLCCPMKALSEEIVFSLHFLSRRLVTPYPSLTRQVILQLLVISSSNVFGDETLSWLGWFRLGCRINHSCLPNASWTLQPSPSSSSSSPSAGMPVLVFTALQEILPGREITHSYLERERWYAKASRQQTLFSARGFVCGCQECLLSCGRGDESRICGRGGSADGGAGRVAATPKETQTQTQTQTHVSSDTWKYDRKRVFACPLCEVSSSVVAVEQEGEEGAQHTHMRCLQCGVVLTRSDHQQLLQYEVILSCLCSSDLAAILSISINQSINQSPSSFSSFSSSQALYYLVYIIIIIIILS